MSPLTFRERPAAASPRACSCSTTAAAPTSTTCSRSATCSTRSGACTWPRRARRSRCPAGPATTGTWCRGSATPTRTRSTPRTAELAAFHDELWERTGVDARAHRARRLLDGLGDELLARPRRGPPGARRASSRSPASCRWSTAGSRTSRIARARAPSSPTAATTRSWPSTSPASARELLEAGGLDVEYHESDAGHHIDPAHVPAAVDWLAATLS